MFKPDTSAPTPGDVPRDKPVRIGDVLLDKGLITQDQIEEALAFQKEKGHKRLLGEILVELEFVSEELVLETLAETFNVPFARITPKVVDARVIEALPRDFLESNTVLPLFKVGNKLTVAINELTNVFLVEEIARLAECQVQLVAATAKDIRSTLDSHMPNANVFVIDEIVDDIGSEDMSVVEKQITDLTNLEEAAGDSPVIKLVNYVIYTAVQDGASDIHIEPDEGTLRVRYRVDGKLFEKLRPPHQLLPAVVSRIKIMASLDISERRIPQDGAITVMLGKSPVDLRVSTMAGQVRRKGRHARGRQPRRIGAAHLAGIQRADAYELDEPDRTTQRRGPGDRADRQR